MRILMEPTEHVVWIDGIECRLWNGVTDDDQQVFVFVHRVATREDIKELFERTSPTTLTTKGGSIQ